MHADLDLLALLALGEDAGTDEERAHVERCADCAREVSELQRAVNLGREAGPDPLVHPRSVVWARIRSELGLEPNLEPVTNVPAAPLATVPSQASALASESAAGFRATTPDDDPDDLDDMDDLDDLLERMAVALPASSEDRRAELTGFARLHAVELSSEASAVATVRVDGDGRRILELALSADGAADGLRQAWLVHRGDPTRRLTIGILDGPFGVWTIDQRIDLDELAVLEVSQQATGQPADSGSSLVRGELVAVG